MSTEILRLGRLSASVRPVRVPSSVYRQNITIYRVLISGVDQIGGYPSKRQALEVAVEALRVGRGNM